MFDVNDFTISEIDEEYERTLNKLERLSQLRQAVIAQDQRRIKKLIVEYKAAKAQEGG